MVAPVSRVAIAVLAALAVGGCAGQDGGRTELLVSAAASLTDVFTEIETVFESRHSDIDVALNFGGSSALREQILGGAPVDVLAVADEATMADLAAAGAVDDVTIFARNTMEIAVPAGNPAGVTGITDLGRDELLIGLCAPAVPCGGLALALLDAADIVAAADTEEPDVRSLLTKIAAGELDAGIVYRTDVIGGAGVDGVPIPGGVNVVTAYPIAAIEGGRNATAARTFVEFVASDAGRAILERHGFLPP